MYFVDNKDGYGSPSFTLGVTAQSRDLGIARGLVLGCRPMAAAITYSWYGYLEKIDA